MEVLEPGHIYALDVQDGDQPEILRFVNREGTDDHPGTQTQEVLRALIDRTMHCDNCLRWEGNDLIIQHLRMALALHEARAILRKTVKGIIKPELIVTGNDGHFGLMPRHNTADGTEYALTSQLKKTEGGIGGPDPD